MKEYLILKLEGDDPRSAKVVTVVQSEDEPEDILPQGFVGDGRYAIVDWTERVEGSLAPGPVALNAVEDRAAREKRDEASRRKEAQ